MRNASILLVFLGGRREIIPLPLLCFVEFLVATSTHNKCISLMNMEIYIPRYPQKIRGYGSKKFIFTAS